MPSPIRWGLLGTARINRSIIPAIRGLARHELIGVASRSREAAASYAREWDIPRAYGSYAELLADPDIDAVYNPLPNALHAEWTIRACEAGKHVLCEKPLALSVQEVDLVAAAAERAGLLVAEAFMYRHHPQTLRLKALVDAGAIGALRLVRGAFTFTLTRPADVRLVAALGGGSLWDVGCYPVNIARYLAGSEPRLVWGSDRTGESGIDEAFYGELDFGDVHAQFDCGFRAPFRTHLEVVGTDGSITASAPFKPGLEETLVLTRDGGAETIQVDGEALYSGQLENFADVVLLGAAPRITLADTRGNVACLTALYEAARRGVPLPPAA